MRLDETGDGRSTYETRPDCVLTPGALAIPNRKGKPGTMHQRYHPGRLLPRSPSPNNLPRLLGLSLLLALAFVASSCTPSQPVEETDYSAKILGHWLGTAGDYKESIRFRPDGSFEAQLRPLGFISNTLSQGVTGTIRGAWTISGKTVTLKITSAEDERVTNSTTSSTILAFTTNELEVKSDRGETSNFLRASSP